MAKKSKKVKKSKKTERTNKIAAGVYPARTDYPAVLPGVMMCLMIILMLIIDITVPAAKNKQYQDFQAIFRVLNFAAAAGGTLFLVTAFARKNRQPLSASAHDRVKGCLKENRLTWIMLGGFLLCVLISTAVNGPDEKAVHGVPFFFIFLGLSLCFTD